MAETQLEALLTKFEQARLPIPVSFREMLSVPSLGDRATHDLHPYPAKLLVNIPSFFLSTHLSRPGDLVLDPFCGSGTVLLAAILTGRNATGADANPLARLLTQVKLTPISSTILGHARHSFFQRRPAVARRSFPDVVNVEYWFYPHVRRDLLRLCDRISRIRNKAVREFFFVALSACIKDVSLADPRLSVPVRLRENQYPRGHWLREPTNWRLRRLRRIDVFAAFSRRLDENIDRAESLDCYPELGQYLGLASDARALTHLSSGSIDLVITSPPYLGAQKYVRASSLNLGWLGFCNATSLREMEGRIIGREHYRKEEYASSAVIAIPSAGPLLAKIRKLNPLRAHIAATYLCEMKEAFREMARVLKPARHVVLVAGESRVCGITFPTPSFLVELAAAEGLALRLHLVDTIRSRALMTKRNHTAGRIDTESIMLLRKEA